MTRPFIYGPTGAQVPMFRTAHLAPVALAPLPADFDAMLAAAPSLTGSADMAWMGLEGDVNDGEDFTAEEDGEL